VTWNENGRRNEVYITLAKVAVKSMENAGVSTTIVRRILVAVARRLKSTRADMNRPIVGGLESENCPF
jgi:hypothetical protein